MCSKLGHPSRLFEAVVLSLRIERIRPSTESVLSGRWYTQHCELLLTFESMQRFCLSGFVSLLFLASFVANAHGDPSLSFPSAIRHYKFHSDAFLQDSVNNIAATIVPTPSAHTPPAVAGQHNFDGFFSPFSGTCPTGFPGCLLSSSSPAHPQHQGLHSRSDCTTKHDVRSGTVRLVRCTVCFCVQLSDHWIDFRRISGSPVSSP